VPRKRKSPSANKSGPRRSVPRKSIPPVSFIESMECLPVANLPAGPQWTYEIKLYRLATGVWTWKFAGENMR
jgi:hypothetical protein